jgi:hypothetical protein
MPGAAAHVGHGARPSELGEGLTYVPRVLSIPYFTGA